MNKSVHIGRPKPRSAENWRKAVATLTGRPAWNRKSPVVKQCESCERAYSVAPSRAQRSRFCSKACDAAWRRTRTGAGHPLYRKVERPCEFCGKTVAVKPAKLSEFRFCSRRCIAGWVATTWPRSSSIERALRVELARREIPFSPDYAVGPFVVDIALPAHKLAVEADGTYWHGTARQQARDRQKDGYLHREGWRVLRLSESRIRADVVACVGEIVAMIKPPVPAT